MAGTINITIIMLIAAMMILAIPIIVGCYVYKDAKRRNMDATLWTLVAILVPGLIGLIIYLIVRGNSSDVICPVCEKEASDSYVLCPHCGNPLKACCGNCHAVIDPSWKLCPQCGTEIRQEDFAQVKIPKPKKDKGIRTLVIVLIAVPLCALLIGIVGLTQYMVVGPHSGSYGLTQGFHIEVDSDTLMPEVRAWINDCDNQGAGVYALRLSPGNIMESEKYDDMPEQVPNLTYFVYVYVNNFRGNDQIAGLNSEVKVNSKTLDIEFFTIFGQEDGLTDGYELTEIYTTNEQIKNIRIFIDGEKVDFVMSELD